MRIPHAAGALGWLPRFALGLAVLALPALSGCDLFDDNGDGELDLDELEDLLGCDVREIDLDDTESGSLSSGDCELTVDGSFVDFWAFELDDDTDIRIDLESNDFDAYLLLGDQDGDDIAIDSDDDDGADTDDVVTVSLDAGVYIIGANSAFGGETGSYTLTLSED